MATPHSICCTWPQGCTCARVARQPLDTHVPVHQHLQECPAGPRAAVPRRAREVQVLQHKASQGQREEQQGQELAAVRAGRDRGVGRGDAMCSAGGMLHGGGGKAMFSAGEVCGDRGHTAGVVGKAGGASPVSTPRGCLPPAIARGRAWGAQRGSWVGQTPSPSPSPGPRGQHTVPGSPSRTATRLLPWQVSAPRQRGDVLGTRSSPVPHASPQAGPITGC